MTMDEKPAPADASPEHSARPAFVSAPSGDAEREEQAAAEKRADAREKAAFARAAAKDKEDAEEERKTRLAGFAAAPKPGDDDTALKPPASDTPDFDLRGKGWIYCGKDARGRGTWVRDRGGEIEIPYSKSCGMSPGQIQMVRTLAQQKGWTQLCAFKGSGRGIDAVATQLLASGGMPCCADAKMAGSISAWRKSGIEAMKAMQCEMHNRAQAASSAPH
ncbi:MAG: hypothetical protein HYU57_05525 [Micavibrio aeruginosavorus]|nr:hypothetical protein [Micavibrio aeruginosavorus]